ncbi:GDCCVxC domain-containing (seleno)protein [Sphingosinicella sp.]|uniref:GDCCVxC domain-containing (seleno)protein n=1 Tax=Sphingosinicella sp. TaxID=1917971 RepID=UPI0040377358
MQLISTLVCPECGGASQETMPTEACQYFYDCPHCGAVLRPIKGYCCVFCSYGDVPCPPIQEANATGQIASCGGGGCDG